METTYKNGQSILDPELRYVLQLPRRILGRRTLERRQPNAVFGTLALLLELRIVGRTGFLVLFPTWFCQCFGPGLGVLDDWCRRAFLWKLIGGSRWGGLRVP